MLLLCLGVAFLGCQRRPLEDKSVATALIPFHIDWSQSGLEQSKIKRASIWFFPHDGSPSFEWRTQSNITDAIVPLPAGKYSIVVFNETTDTEDWAALRFGGQEKYETFHIYTTMDNFKGLYSKAGEADIRKTPEAISSWSLNEFEVTPEMISYTRGDTKGVSNDAITKSLKSVSDITPLPLTIAIKITAYVQNLKSASRCSAALEGATGKISLATGQPIKETVTHVFIMNKRKYDTDNPLNGTIEATILLFKFIEEDVAYGLQLDFALPGSTDAHSERFDITDKIDKGMATIEVNIGYDQGENDHQITLPKAVIGDKVTVDNWTEDVPVAIK